MEFSKGDQVQVYIPQASDPDHRYHGETGVVMDVMQDDLADITDTPGRGHIYTVKFDDPDLEPADFRYDDLQTPDAID